MLDRWATRATWGLVVLAAIWFGGRGFIVG
jgi:hypothetical protein